MKTIADDITKNRKYTVVQSGFDRDTWAGGIYTQTPDRVMHTTVHRMRLPGTSFPLATVSSARRNLITEFDRRFREVE